MTFHVSTKFSFGVEAIATNLLESKALVLMRDCSSNSYLAFLGSEVLVTQEMHFQNAVCPKARSTSSANEVSSLHVDNFDVLFQLNLQLTSMRWSLQSITVL